MVATDPKKIAHVPLTHVDDVAEQMRADVLAKAHEEFGYCADSFGSQGPLAAALQKLDIAPLDKAAVEQYMKSKEKKWTVNWQPLGRLLMIVGPTLTLYALYRVACLGFGWDPAQGDPQGRQFAWQVLSIVAGVVGTLFWNIENASIGSHRKYERSWTRFQFGKLTNYDTRNGRPLPPYEGYIPVHALNAAVQVRSEVPNAQFSIHELTLTVAKVPAPLPDPFLSVSLGSEMYYLSVWDERDFEARA